MTAYAQTLDPELDTQSQPGQHVDVEDEPGAIAIVATILSSHGLSIKNIGIVHNRIYEEGALRIEFYDRESMALGIADLMEKGYKIFSRT